MTDQKRAGEIAAALLAWYDANKRDLPWRHTKNPYFIWVCEVMAQQTQISFLLKYYLRFIERFPTIQSLALADEDAVLKAWEGLGYYSRARNLQKAAQKVMSDFGGELPRTKEELLSLSGIGEYTAGAILSIAYGIPTPAVDGNVLRVFSRVQNSDADITLSATKQTAAEFVSRIMINERAGCFTQALMELGALICTPKNPQCPTCPVVHLCKAKKTGRQEELPVKTAKKPPKIQDKTVLIIRNEQGEILMRQRTEKLLSGLWEFYMTDTELHEDEVKNHLQILGFSPTEIRPAGTAKHIFTHMIWHMTGYDCRCEGDTCPDGYTWVTPQGAKALATPVAIRFYTDKI